MNMYFTPDLTKAKCQKCLKFMKFHTMYWCFPPIFFLFLFFASNLKIRITKINTNSKALAGMSIVSWTDNKCCLQILPLVTITT